MAETSSRGTHLLSHAGSEEVLNKVLEGKIFTLHGVAGRSDGEEVRWRGINMTLGKVGVEALSDARSFILAPAKLRPLPGAAESVVTALMQVQHLSEPEKTEVEYEANCERISLP